MNFEMMASMMCADFGNLEREADMLSELPQQKEIKAAISHIKMAEDFIADLVFPTEEE